MKILVMLTAILAVAASYPTVKTWTLNELSEVIEKSEGDPALRKYYIDALNIIMYALYTGKNEAAVHVIVIAPSGNMKWTLPELRTALDDPALAKLRPYFMSSYTYLKNAKPAETEAEVFVPALDISTWPAHDVDTALNDPDTKPGLKPYLEHARKEILKEHKNEVSMITPVGLIHHSIKEVPEMIAKVLKFPNQSPLSILSLL